MSTQGITVLVVNIANGSNANSVLKKMSRTKVSLNQKGRAVGVTTRINVSREELIDLVEGKQQSLPSPCPASRESLIEVVRDAVFTRMENGARVNYRIIVK